jgi:hypothetical protein
MSGFARQVVHLLLDDTVTSGVQVAPQETHSAKAFFCVSIGSTGNRFADPAGSGRRDTGRTRDH